MEFTQGRIRRCPALESRGKKTANLKGETIDKGKVLPLITRSKTEGQQYGVLLCSQGDTCGTGEHNTFRPVQSSDSNILTMDLLAIQQHTAIPKNIRRNMDEVFRLRSYLSANVR